MSSIRIPINKFLAAAALDFRGPGSRLTSIDRILIATLALLAMSYLYFDVSMKQVKGSYYQREYAPAVMDACGRGFVNPANPAEISELADFLRQGRNDFSCDSIPLQTELKPLTKFHKGNLYTLKISALIWKYTGVSWNSLRWISYFFFVSNTIIFFLLFRLGMGRVLSLIGTTIVSTSTIHLEMIPHIRDYSKSTFVLLAFYLMAILVVHKHKFLSNIGISCLAGLVVGLGLGFRSDILVMIPFFLVTILFAQADPAARYNRVLQKLLIGLVFFATFYIAGQPILSSMQKGGNIAHVILLGTMTPFDKSIGVQGADTHSFGYRYNDDYALSIINFSSQQQGDFEYHDLASSGYEKAGFDHLKRLVITYPADFLARAIGSVTQIITFENRINSMVFIVAAVIIGSISLRYGLYFLISVVYLSAYPMLQFHPRHYFYLEFIGLWVLLFLVTVALLASQALTTNLGSRMEWLVPPRSIPMDTDWKRIRNSLVTNTAIFSILLLMLLGARYYQQSKESTVQTRLLEIKSKKLGGSYAENESDANKSIYRFNYGPFGSSGSGYVVVDIDPTRCNGMKTFHLDYRAITPFADHSQSFRASDSVPERWLIRVFSYQGSNFQGVNIAHSARNCFSVSRLDSLTEEVPLIDYTLPLDPKGNYRAYQLTPQEISLGQASQRDITNYIFSSEVSIEQFDRILYQAATKTSWYVADNKMLNPYVRTKLLKDNSISIESNNLPLFTYLASADIGLFSDSIVMIDGELNRGSISIGLIKNDRWIQQRFLQTTGKFKLVLKSDHAGTYSLTVANGGHKELSVKIRKITIYP